MTIRQKQAPSQHHVKRLQDQAFQTMTRQSTARPSDIQLILDRNMLPHRRQQIQRSPMLLKIYRDVESKSMIGFDPFPFLSSVWGQSWSHAPCDVQRAFQVYMSKSRREAMNQVTYLGFFPLAKAHWFAVNGLGHGSSKLFVLYRDNHHTKPMTLEHGVIDLHQQATLNKLKNFFQHVGLIGVYKVDLNVLR